MKQEIYFCHIPKTAGKTVSAIFDIVSFNKNKLSKKILVGESYFYRVQRKQHPDYYKYYLKEEYYKLLIKENEWSIAFFHLPISFWKDNLIIDLKKKFTIFLVIRNPYDRIVSVFKFWIAYYKGHKSTEKNSNRFYGKLLRQLEDIFENNFKLTKNNLNKVIRKVLSSQKYKYYLDGHLIPQYKYVYVIINKNLIKIPNVVLRFENFEKDFIKFKNKYANHISNNLVKSIHKNPSSKNLNINDLEDDTKKLIYNYYNIDFKIFGYNE